MKPGANRISAAIGRAQTEGRAALLVCLPLLALPPRGTAALYSAVVEAGADMVEFRSSYPHRPEVALSLIKRLPDDGTPKLLWIDDRTARDFALTNAMPFRLIDECPNAGVDGLIAPLEGSELYGFSVLCGETVAPIFFTGFGWGFEQRKMAARYSRGFVYVVDVPPIFGNDPASADYARQFIDELGREAPAVLGAGIRGPAQAEIASREAEGIAVASAVSKLIQEAGNLDDAISRTADFVRALRTATTRR